MTTQDFTTTLLVDQSPKEVFDAINNVRAWWNEGMEGSSEKLHDEFNVRFGDVHYSKHRIVELVPNEKVAWLVTDSQLNFIKKRDEWMGTMNVFEISIIDNKTQVRFTHQGLVPAIECFGDCSKGWQHYIGSLFDLLTTGKGHPHVVKA